MTRGLTQTITLPGLRDGDRSGPVTSQILSLVASRVVTAKGKAEPIAAQSHESLLRPEYIEMLVAAVSSPEPNSTTAFLADMRRRGLPVEDLVDIYIPVAARQIGEDWVTDDRSFAEVTIASARLQSLLRDIAAEWRADDSIDTPGPHSPSILLVVPDGADHTLGPMVAACQFRRLGASVRLALGQSNIDVAAIIGRKPFDMIGIAVSSGDRLENARLLIKLLRATVQQVPPIVVGGPLQSIRNDLKCATDADYISSDPAEALGLCGLSVGKSVSQLPKDRV